VADKWIVLKFGGTSVAGRPQWEKIASLASQRRSDGYRVLLVCSAVAGVTNRLAALATQPAAADALEELLNTHRALGRDLEVDESAWLPEARRNFQACLEVLQKEPGPGSQAALLAMGEWLSTRIGYQFLRATIDVDWVDARDALEILPETDRSPARRWLSAACTPGTDPGLEGRWSKLKPVLVTQGFVARSESGGTALLGRGGSDTSAALLAGRLSASRLEIWTDVPGLFSADPRLIADARLLVEVDYAEALEMAASGATVVHPRCIRAAAATGTPVEVRDLNRSDLPGTRIGQADSGQAGIKTVTCQKNMAVMLLQNLDARFEVGFLAGVFEIFRRRGVSVDLVATSETTTTVAVNCPANHLGRVELEDLAGDLGARCTVQLYPDCVCINLVGHGARTALSRLARVMRHFEDHPLLMVSQSANDLCLSLLVPDADHQVLLRGAHDALIPRSGGATGGVFGPSWTEIQQVGRDGP
jgi:diaminopimelate decarboxylase/aspartate kinase